MSADLEHIRQIMREADCLYTEAEVEAAIARVERYYTDSMMFGSYRTVYQKALGGPATDEAR